jgi:hypothetical protein
MGRGAESTSLITAKSLVEVRGRVGWLLEEQPPKKVPQAEEHEDHDRHNRGDQAHHL